MVKIEEWSNKEIDEACSFRNLVNHMYDKIQFHDGGGKYAFRKSVRSREDFKNWQKEFRAEIIESLKIKDMLKDRHKIKLVKSARNSHWNEKAYVIERFYIESWMDTLIPVLLCVPKSSEKRKIRVPAVICAHGHTMRKENLVGKKRNLIYRSKWAKDLVKMGCITISMDQWGFGERGVPPWKAFRKLRKRYTPEAKYAQNMLQFGRTILGLRVFDTIRQVDYLLTRDDVDPKRIGIAGLSMGGLIAGVAGAIDPRISMLIIAGYLSTYKDSIIDISRKHCADMYTPGMLMLGEEYDMLGLIAPRPVCFIAGEKDGIFPIEAAKKAFEEVKKAYRLLKAEDKCVLDAAPIGHGWRGDVAYDFLKKTWL